KPLTLIRQLWENGQFINRTYIQYTYDPDGNLVEQLNQQADSTGAWQIESRFLYTYDTNQNILTFLSQGWENDSWQNGSLVETTRNTAGEITFSTWQIWQDSTMTWGPFERYTHTFDISGNRLLDIHERWGQGQWDTYYTKRYYYDESVSIADQLTVSHQVAPNPFESRLTFTFPASAESTVLTIYDQQGREVGYQYTGPHAFSMQWAAPGALTNGLYTYRLTQGEKVSTGKVLLQH
ncbi:MAG: T9SS type A sorting domain-containing protein, partial [Bacteroidota bacterium]